MQQFNFFRRGVTASKAKI